jgi:hypothetical protein
VDTREEDEDEGGTLIVVDAVDGEFVFDKGGG